MNRPESESDGQIQKAKEMEETTVGMATGGTESILHRAAERGSGLNPLTAKRSAFNDANQV